MLKATPFCMFSSAILRVTVLYSAHTLAFLLPSDSYLFFTLFYYIAIPVGLSYYNISFFKFVLKFIYI